MIPVLLGILAFAVALEYMNALFAMIVGVVVWWLAGHVTAKI